MKKISKNKYVNFESIFQETEWELSGMAVLEGNNPGTLWSDRETDARSAFMATPEGYLLAGDPADSKFCAALKLWFQNEFLIRGIKENYFEFEILFRPKWHDKVKEIFSARPLYEYDRRHYILEISDRQPKKLTLPEEMKLVDVDPAFVQLNGKMKNMKHLKQWIINNWGNMDNFKKKGFAESVVKNGTIASWSVADCVYHDRCEIGIQSDENYRRRGLAHYIVETMIEKAIHNQIKQIGWHCPERNTGSRKTAEKSGFRLERKYKGYYGYFNKSRHVLMAGYAALERGAEMEQVKKIFNSVAKLVEENKYHYYDLACGFALTGEVKKGESFLRKAIEAGYDNFRHLLQDKHLENLHKTELWQELLKKT